MRRTPQTLALLLVAALVAGGCATIDAPDSADLHRLSRVRPERPAVPDAVMLRDQVGSYYRDTPVP